MPLLETVSPGRLTIFCPGDERSEVSLLSQMTRSSLSPAAISGSGEVAERVIQTLKVELVWTRDFETIDELREAMAAWMAALTLRHRIAKTGAKCVANGNPGCSVQLEAGVRASGTDVEIAHPITLLARAYRAEK